MPNLSEPASPFSIKLGPVIESVLNDINSLDVSFDDWGQLHLSGLSTETIRSNGLFTSDTLNALVIPYRDLKGKLDGFQRWRPHTSCGGPKYLQRSGTTSRAYFPVSSLPKIRDGKSPIHLVEGEKKALKLAQLGLAAIGIGGITSGYRSVQDDSKTRHKLIEDLAAINWQGRSAYIHFDWEERQSTSQKVEDARRRLAKVLRRAGVGEVFGVEFPGGSGEKQGADDFIQAHGRSAFLELIENAKPVPSEHAIVPVSFPELARQYPDIRPPVVNGIARQGEVVNVIAPTKVGKSWLTYGLALSTANGKPWLGRFSTRRGKVLMIDNELHENTIVQ